MGRKEFSEMLHSPLLKYLITPEQQTFFCFVLRILFIYFSERGQGREKEKERSIEMQLYIPRPGSEPITQARALTRNRTGDLWLCGTVPT